MDKEQERRNRRYLGYEDDPAEEEARRKREHDEQEREHDALVNRAQLTIGLLRKIPGRTELERGQRYHLKMRLTRQLAQIERLEKLLRSQ